MKNIKFLTVLIATALFVACGESSFSGTSAPQKKAAARTDAKAESPTAGACGCAWAKNPPAASPAPAPKP